MKFLFSNPCWLLLLLLILAGLGGSGCASTEAENQSERPWSTPQSWENGIPGGMMDQRR
jgi:hypothetical protein